MLYKKEKKKYEDGVVAISLRKNLKFVQKYEYHHSFINLKHSFQIQD